MNKDIQQNESTIKKWFIGLITNASSLLCIKKVVTELQQETKLAAT